MSWVCVNSGELPNLSSMEEMGARTNSILQIDQGFLLTVLSYNKQAMGIYGMYLGGESFSLKAINLKYTSYEPRKSAVLIMRKGLLHIPFVGFGSTSSNARKLSRQISCLLVPFINS